MTDAKPRREYTAEVVSIGKQQSGDGWVLVLKARPGMKYPDSFYGKAETLTLVKDLKPGQRYTFVLERDRLKKNKTEGSKLDFDYFETLLEVRSAPAEAPATPSAPGTETGRVSEFRTPEQIIRGVALEQATALAVALIAGGQNLRSPEVLVIASKYETYILSGKMPRMPAVPASAEQVAEDMADLGFGEAHADAHVAIKEAAPALTGGSQAPLLTGGHSRASQPTELTRDDVVKEVKGMLGKNPQSLFDAISGRTHQQVESWQDVWQRARLSPAEVLDAARLIKEQRP